MILYLEPECRVTDENQSSLNPPPQAIFRAYDIRGVVDQQLNSDNIELIGQSIGSEALARICAQRNSGGDGAGEAERKASGADGGA